MNRKVQNLNPKVPRLGRPKGKNVENAHRRRKQLIDAVVSSIVENGLSATTFSTVARASGLSEGTAVFYFQNKETLLAAAFRDRMEKYRTAWRDALSAAGPDPVGGHDGTSTAHRAAGEKPTPTAPPAQTARSGILPQKRPSGAAEACHRDPHPGLDPAGLFSQYLSS